MGFDYFTIRHLTAELGQHLEGETIDWVGCCRWGLGLRCRPSVSLEARLVSPGYLCLRPGRPSPDLEFRSGPERYLVGAEVADIRSDERDRIIRMRLIRRDRSGVPTCGQLIFELIHPHYQIALAYAALGQREEAARHCELAAAGGFPVDPAFRATLPATSP